MHFAFRTVEYEVGSLDTEVLEAGLRHLGASFSSSTDRDGYGLYRVILDIEKLGKLAKHVQLATESRRKIKNIYIPQLEIYFHTRRFLFEQGMAFEEEWIDGEQHYYVTASIADYQALETYGEQEYERITGTE